MGTKVQEPSALGQIIEVPKTSSFVEIKTDGLRLDMKK